MKRAHNISELRQLLIEELDIQKFVKNLIKMAMGGKRLKNGNGVVYRSLPNLDASKLILQYMYGTPQPEQAQANESLSKISKVLEDLLLPNKPKAVNNSGELVDNPLTEEAKNG